MMDERDGRVNNKKVLVIRFVVIHAIPIFPKEFLFLLRPTETNKLFSSIYQMWLDEKRGTAGVSAV